MVKIVDRMNRNDPRTADMAGYHRPGYLEQIGAGVGDGVGVLDDEDDADDADDCDGVDGEDSDAESDDVERECCRRCWSCGACW